MAVKIVDGPVVLAIADIGEFNSIMLKVIEEHERLDCYYEYQIDGDRYLCGADSCDWRGDNYAQHISDEIVVATKHLWFIVKGEIQTNE